MADVAADLREALNRILGPWRAETLDLSVTDYGMLAAIRDEAAKRWETAANDGDRSRLAGVRSVVFRLAGDLESAETDAKATLAYAESVGTDLLLAPARARLGQVLRLRGEYEQADKLYALAEAGELPRGLIGRVRAVAALSCISQRRFTEALLHLERASEFSGDPSTTSLMAPALERVSAQAGEGFGPPPRKWEERAGYPAPRRFQDPRTGKWGFMNHDRKVIIPAAYAAAGEFRGGICAVKEQAWGAILSTGAQTVPFMYDRLNTSLPDGRSVVGFVDGVAVVDRRGAKGLINRTGKVILPPHHRDIVVHPAGYAVDHGSATWGAHSHHGEELVPARFDRDAVLRRLDTLVLVDEGPL
ncbi:MAG: WG repeat-containing protein [Stackebrandtia sp.]